MLLVKSKELKLTQTNYEHIDKCWNSDLVFQGSNILFQRQFLDQRSQSNT
jgi:hypothetical protein